MATDFFNPVYMEDCFIALLAKLQTATFAGGITMKGYFRVHLIPDEIPPAQQPSLYLVPGPMHVEQKEFALAKWTFTAIALIYLRGDISTLTPNPLPAKQANYIIWGLSNALLAEPVYEKQTLGGLVTHCWIEGEIYTEVSSDQVVIGIPIFMLAGNVG